MAISKIIADSITDEAVTKLVDVATTLDGLRSMIP